MIFKVSFIQEKITRILQQYGCSKKVATIASSVLLEGNLKGYPSHGIGRIFQIIDGFKNKTISTSDTYKILKENSVLSIWDAEYILGNYISVLAMKTAIKKAKKHGIGLVGVINSSHIGMLSYYSELASKENCIGIVITTSSPAVVLKGSVKKIFGTNPISYSIPNKPYPITADFATSKVSRGLVYEYLKNNMIMPIGWGVDETGHDTTEPAACLKGGLLTIDNDKKGAFISLLISILAGPLIGGVPNTQVVGTRDMHSPPNKGDLFFALDITKFTDLEIFKKQIKIILQDIATSKTSFRQPGIRSAQAKENSIQKGIKITDKRLLTLLQEI